MTNMKVTNPMIPRTVGLLAAALLADHSVARDLWPAFLENSRILFQGDSITDGRLQVTFLDIRKKLLEPDGSLSRDVSFNGTHPTEKGYAIWGHALSDAGVFGHKLQEKGASNPGRNFPMAFRLGSVHGGTEFQRLAR